MKIKILVLFSLLLSVTARAQNSSSDTIYTYPDSVINSYINLPLDDLLKLKVTTGSFLDLDLQSSTMSLTIISKEQIQLSGAKHLTSVLEIYVPGFQYMVNKWNGLIWGMRGVAPDRNTNFVFLVNGHKMNHESRDGAMSELDLGLLDDVERIEVLRGPGGLVYGSGAMAGVINLVTKSFEGNNIVASSKVETWGLNTFGQEFQGSISRELDNNTTIKVDVGLRSSQGVGAERSRLYGRPGWPYPQYLENPPSNGVPTNGSAHSTPGNGKISFDLRHGNWSFYSRWTHQVTNGSGWFTIDPWPEIIGAPDSLASDRIVDGESIGYNSFLANTESYGFNRRQYVINNLTNQVTYDIQLKKNTLQFKTGMDAASNSIRLEKMDQYLSTNERAVETLETFGERRYNLGVLYSYNSHEKLQFASGVDFRVYDIGNDFSGLNAQNEKKSHPIVSDINYLYTSIFTEGLYDLTNKFDIHFGLRYDLHTRTIKHGGVLNPKLGLLYSLNEENTIKLVYQQSANNGSADSYEFNRNSFDDNGNPVTSDNYHYENPYTPPTSSSPIIPPVNEEILHSLKPEISQSVELMGFHKLTNKLIALQSYSFNKVSNLFAWNQTLFRIVNSGSYQFVNMDLELQYHTKKINFGVNHSYQRTINMDVVSENENVEIPVFEGWDSTLVGNQYYYSPKPLKNSLGNDSIITNIINPIADGITVDGTNFINLNTNISKIFVDFKVLDWLTIHTNCRVFWGLKGRKDIHEYSTESNQNEALERLDNEYKNNQSYPYLDIHDSPMIKWDLGLILHDQDQFSFALHVYNILGNVGSRNSLRWQKSGLVAEHTDLYGIDLRSYSAKLTYTF